jgi:hypothetical protein
VTQVTDAAPNKADEDFIDDLCEMKWAGGAYSGYRVHELNYRQRVQKTAEYREAAVREALDAPSAEIQSAHDELDAAGAHVFLPTTTFGDRTKATLRERIHQLRSVKLTEMALDAQARRVFAALCPRCWAGKSVRLLVLGEGKVQVREWVHDYPERGGGCTLCEANAARIVADPDGRLAGPEEA